MKPMVALYKAFRGGEWFSHSLQSIKGSVEKIFVVMSRGGWDGGDQENNCIAAIEDFQKANPGVLEVVWHETSRQEEQYKAGLGAILEACGDSVSVLIIDTDEVWEQHSLDNLRRRIQAHPEIGLFTSRISTYIRSPLYQVYPQESGTPVVGLQSATLQPNQGRYSFEKIPCSFCDDACFHHFPYVRSDEGEIRAKFLATSSQEKDKSNPVWLNTTWPKVPRVRDFHMSIGYERCWREIKVLPGPPIALPAFCTEVIAREEERWKSTLEGDSPNSTLIPVPTEHDRAMYPEFSNLAPSINLLCARLKMTYLEAMVLHRLCQAVPACGAMLEIGSGSGGSLACMAMGSGASLWAVDPFTPYNETTHAGIARGVTEGNEGQFWNTAEAYGYAARTKHIKANSDIAATQCPDEHFDVVLIDGNHTYEIALADLRAYWPKIKPGGTLLLHDYTTRFPGVIQAAKEWGVPYSVYAGTSMAYARKPS